MGNPIDDSYGIDDDSYPNDFAEHYRKRQDDLLAELNTFEIFKIGVSKELNQISRFEQHDDSLNQDVANIVNDYDH